MMEILWEMPFHSSFLIVLYHWFTNYYHIIYENMRNEYEKTFAEAEFSGDCWIQIVNTTPPYESGWIYPG